MIGAFSLLGFGSALLASPETVGPDYARDRVVEAALRPRTLAEVVGQDRVREQLSLLLEAVKSTERDVPDYVEVDHGKMTAKLVRMADQFFDVVAQ